MKVILDPGHGGRESGAVAFGETEKSLNLVFSSLLSAKLEQEKFDVDRSLIQDVYLDSTQLTDLIKKSGASLCISCHLNASNGTARGFEAIHSIHEDGQLANLMLEEVRKTGFPVRRAFSRESTSRKGQDYYYVIRLTYPQVETVIVEFGFMDNPEDFKLLTDILWQERLTTAVAAAVRKYLWDGNDAKTQILGKPILTAGQIQKALLDVDASTPDGIVEAYYRIAPIYSIKADLAFLQAVYETNWFRFTGVDKIGQHNYAGLGAIGAGIPGVSFPTMEVGVEAHLQHLYAYASTSELPAGQQLYDTRFSLVKRGSAQYWEDLDGKWAVPGIGYGAKILRLQKQVMEKYPPEESNVSAQKESPAPSVSATPQPAPTPHWAKPDNDELLAAGILYDDHSHTLDQYATEGLVISLVNRLRKELGKK